MWQGGVQVQAWGRPGGWWTGTARRSLRQRLLRQLQGTLRECFEPHQALHHLECLEPHQALYHVGMGAGGSRDGRP